MTGCGALIALIFFLPLPAKFSEGKHMTRTEALKHTFYVVAGVAWTVGLVVFIGLRGGGVGGNTWEFWKTKSFTRFGKLWKGKNTNNPSTSSIDEEARHEAGEGNDGPSHERSALLPDSSSIQNEDSNTQNYGSTRSSVAAGETANSSSWKTFIEGYFQGLWLALKAGGEDWRIGLGYLGGFVAR
ncbi:hypothetical protein ABW20_dc0101016 [Dactylellina cionopaga]|nr:hypothetical protein ABW20_dc0101016 [Dactylellina cionopaga]